MFLRQLKWITAGLAVVAAVCAAPGAAKADVQILVEELNAGGGVIASQYTTGASPSSVGALSYSFNGVYFGGTGSISVDQGNNSLNPSFSGFLNPAFTASETHTLRITVTNDNYTVGTGFNGMLQNDAGASQRGLTNGAETVTTFSRIYDPSGTGAVPASSTEQVAGGPTVAGPTPNATISGPGNATPTSSTAAALPSPFAIQQTILISIAAVDPASPVRGTFGATGGAQVAASAAAGVPAPGGMALALAALPLLGLRRLRKRTA